MIQSRSWNASAGFPDSSDQGRSHNMARAASASASAAVARLNRFSRDWLRASPEVAGFCAASNSSRTSPSD